MSEEVEMTPISSDELPPKAAPFGAPAAPEAAAPAAPAAAIKPSTIRLKPVIRKPIIRKPGEAPAASAAPAAPAAAAPAAVAAAPKKTTQSLKSLTGAIPVQATLKKTGILAEGILTPAQQQAAKSKTSRISLESAIGVAPVSSKGPAPLKTIRLRRPTDLNKPAVPKLTPAPAPSPAPAPAPAAANAAAESDPVTAPTLAPLTPTETLAPATGGEPDASVTQKKTLKLHRPGAAIKRPSMGLPVAGAPAGEGATEVDDIPGMPAMDAAFAPAPAAQASDLPGWLSAITLITSIAALLVLGATFYFLYCEGCGPVAGENVTAFIEM